MSCFDADSLLNQAMLMLAAQPRALFLGQNVAYPGTVMYKHLEGVPMDQRVEFPVAEELQLGASLGLSLAGHFVVSQFPRMDFLLRAADQLVNHLDKLELMSRGDFCPKVIIRTRVGSKTPLDAGPQHTGRYTEAFRLMLSNVIVTEIREPDQILPAYKRAIERSKSTLVVENLG